MIEVLHPGFYVFETPHSSYVVEFLRPRTDYSHLVKKLCDGPFEDVKRGEKEIMSGFRVAQMRLSEILAEKANMGWVQHVEEVAQN